MTFPVPEMTRRLWQIRAGILFLLLFAAVAAFTTLSAFIWIACGGVALLGLLLIFVYMPIYFKRCAITVTENAVMVMRGVFIKRTYIMPYPRLIYAQSLTTPLATAFGLCAVCLKAARGMVIIPEMAREDAEILLKSISGGDKG